MSSNTNGARITHYLVLRMLIYSIVCGNNLLETLNLLTISALTVHIFIGGAPRYCQCT